VQRELPVLSAYLGHLVPANTYWHLEASPELLAIVAEKLSASLESRP
jgi:integrase/recombinase XerD